MPNKEHLKRISLMIREDQYNKITDAGLNLSGLVRDLIDDYFSEHKITLTVKEDTKNLYDRIVSNTGCTDDEIEPYLKTSLKELLTDRIAAMQELRNTVFEDEK